MGLWERNGAQLLVTILLEKECHWFVHKDLGEGLCPRVWAPLSPLVLLEGCCLWTTFDEVGGEGVIIMILGAKNF